ncbi:kielin/chordin-like protein [Lycorma delicatula]|uniref:kielin/chordin-like protein n=1 Tax=Lycorma delicatula TaxID=130591 RepID=UPI003F5111A2
MTMVNLSFVLFLLCGVLINVQIARSDECITGSIRKLYEELNCIPEHDETNGCITSYNCSFTNDQRADKCYYQGREFSDGDRLEHNDFRSKCIPTCSCLVRDGRAEFNCAHYDCAEFFQPPLKKNCMRTYSHDSCCAVGVYCKKENEEETAATCEYGGKVYTEGATFFPNEEPCKKCICKPGFSGSLESPWCEEVFCEIEIHHAESIRDNCAPVYFGDNSCCPINFHCAHASSDETQETEVESTTITQKANDNTPTCKFGNSTVEIGRKVRGPEECTECSCKVPPLIECVVNSECQEGKLKTAN